MRKLIAVAVAAAVLGGCSLARSPKPGFKLGSDRAEIEREFHPDGTNKEEKVIGRNADSAAFDFPTNGTLRATRVRHFQPDNKGREVLVYENLAVEATASSTEAMAYGINQTDRAAETTQAGLNAAAAVASGGATEVASQLAGAAVVIANGTAEENTADTLGAALEGVADVNASVPEAAPAPEASGASAATAPADAAAVPASDAAPAVSADDAVTTPAAEVTVPVIATETTPETTF
jgi:hypothetical protein